MKDKILVEWVKRKQFTESYELYNVNLDVVATILKINTGNIKYVVALGPLYCNQFECLDEAKSKIEEILFSKGFKFLPEKFKSIL